MSGETNLPTGSVVHISATRSFLDRGAEEVRAVLLSSIDVELPGSQFDAMLTLDESDMVVVAGVPDPIETVSDRVTVCVQFQTGISAFDEEQRQPDPDVADIVGEYGEELSDSPDAYVFGSATANPANWLEEQAIVRLRPLELDAIANAQSSRPSVDKLDGFCLSRTRSRDAKLDPERGSAKRDAKTLLRPWVSQRIRAHARPAVMRRKDTSGHA